MTESPLQDETLKSVSTSNYSSSSVPRHSPLVTSDSRVEPVYLQLVLERLWIEEFNAKLNEVDREPPWVIHRETLGRIGGADQIVEKYVNDIMSGLDSNKQRRIAARLFPYLVTPSRRKIAQFTKDLVELGGEPAHEVQVVLDKLSRGDRARVLRLLVAPNMYELFHDVLARPVLQWRRRFLEKEDRRRLLQKLALYLAVFLAMVGVVARV